MNREAILGLVRHLLTFGGGFAVSGGYLAEADLPTAVGAALTLIGIVWSALSPEKKAAAEARKGV
jgi:hypothetical protein